MSIEALKEQIPDFAKDVRLNVSSLVNDEALGEQTKWGLLLAVAALSAIIWANSPWAASYDLLTHTSLPVQFGPFAETMTLSGWVKSALMPIFFFVVGLEIKHEILRGELSNPRRLALPILAAAGGVLAAALRTLLGPSWAVWLDVLVGVREDFGAAASAAANDGASFSALVSGTSCS